MNIAGNTTTRDEVIRREFRQFEGSWYDGNRIKLSRDRVDRLGYFKDVTIDTPETQGTSDQVDVNLTVVEKPTGNFMIGGAFSQAEKFTFTAAIQQANFAGSGNTVGLELNTSRYSRTVAFSHTNPYFNDDGVSRSFEIYMRTSRPPALNVGSYTVRQNGGRLSFGVPFSEYDTVFFGFGLERTGIETDDTSPQRFKDYITEFTGIASGVGKATTDAVPLTAMWARDSRDSAVTPTTGRQADLQVDDPGAERRVHLRPRPLGPPLPGVQECLRRRHRFGARLPELFAGYRGPQRRRPGRRDPPDRQRRTAVPVPWQRPGPQPALVHFPGRRPGLPGRTEDPCLRTALLGWPGPVLDFAGGSAQVELC
jgi:hypothetical protein